MKNKLKLIVFVFIALIIGEGLTYGYLIFSEPSEQKKVFHWQAYENFLRLEQKISPWQDLKPHPFAGAVSDSMESDLSRQLWLEPHESYRIGVIGGELANKMAKDLNSKPDHPFLLKLREREKISADKVIEVLSLTTAKARQPQQLQILNLFLGHLDFVLQIDDWTRAELPDKKYLSYFPEDSHLLYPYDQKFWQQFVANFHLDSLAHKMARLAGSMPILAKSNMYYLIWKLAKDDKKESSIVQLKKNKSKSQSEYEKSLSYFVDQESNLLLWSTKPYKWFIIGGVSSRRSKMKPSSQIIFLEKRADLRSVNLEF